MSSTWIKFSPPKMEISDSAGSPYRRSTDSSNRRRARRAQDPRMSARQNKKQRKGRNNANNRERTVTTLTEDPNTPYLVPTPSEEPAGGHLSAHKIHNVPMASQPYQISSNFAGFGFSGTFNTGIQQPQQQQQQQQQQQPSFFQPQNQMQQQQAQPNPPLPAGKNDLEILQNLKKLILDNQHPIFRPVPQPAALAKLYKGPISTPPSQSQGEQPDSMDVEPTSGSGPSDSAGNRPTLTHSKEKISSSPSTRSNSNNPSNTDVNPKAASVGNGSSGGGPQSAGSELLRSPGFAPSQEDTQGRYNNSGHSRATMSDSGSVGGRERSDYPSNAIKREPMEDPMDRVAAGAAHHNNSGKDDLLRSGSWAPKQQPSAVYSEGGPSDSDRSATSRGVGGGGPIASSTTPASNLDTRNTPGGPPGADVHGRGRDRGAADNSRGGWNWQDRNYHYRQGYGRPQNTRQQSYHQPRRLSSTSEYQRDDPAVKKGGPPKAVVESQPTSQVPADSRRPPSDVSRPAATDRPQLHVTSDVPPPVDSQPSVDHLHLDARVPRSSSRIEGDEAHTSGVSSTRPSIDTRATPASSSGLAPPDSIPAQDRLPPPSRQSIGDQNVASGDQQSNLRPSPFQRKKFHKNQGQGGPPPAHITGPNNHGAPYSSPVSDHHPPPPRSSHVRPPSPSSGPPPSSGRSFHPRSSSLEGRRGRFPSPAGSRMRDYRGPPVRDISRDRPGNVYRPDYDADAAPLMRYGESRPFGRDYSPPPPSSHVPGERGPPGSYSSPSSVPPPTGRDWGSYGPSYPHGSRWSADEEPFKSRPWEGKPDRDRYDYPPRSAGWTERDYPARDSYPSGPPPSVDDRYADRGRPPTSVYPSYNRVTRPRSPSPPMRRGDPLDDRPPVKRPREDFDYYPPPASTGGRRAPPGDYPPPPPPPRTAGSPGGPPPGSGSSWPPPPPPSSGSSGGPPPGPGSGPAPDRDYRGGSSYVPSASGGYDRPRSPGPPGRGHYVRGGGYGRDGGRNTYPPPRP